jgi:hypothetical protein
MMGIVLDMYTGMLKARLIQERLGSWVTNNVYVKH